MPPQPVFHSEFTTFDECLVINLQTNSDVLRVNVFRPSVLSALYHERRRPARMIEPAFVEIIADLVRVRDPDHRRGGRDHQPEPGFGIMESRLNLLAFG